MMFDFSPIFSIVVIVCVGSIECNRFNDTNGVRPEYGPKIMNGTFAKAGQFISQVAIVGPGIALPDSNVCGGILIGSNTVLTAAECLSRPTTTEASPPDCENIKVIGDDLNVSNMRPGPERQKRNASKCLLHPRFRPISQFYANDIALIIVDEPFKTTETFAPTPLSIDDIHSIDNEDCQIAGWGVYEIPGRDEEPLTSFELRYINVSVIPHTECNAKYNGSLPENVFCAGRKDPPGGTCDGDTGGALICNGTIKGIATIRFCLATTGYPGVFVRLERYLHWIDDNYGNSSPSTGKRFKLISACLCSLLLCLKLNTHGVE